MPLLAGLPLTVGESSERGPTVPAVSFSPDRILYPGAEADEVAVAQ